MTSSFKNLNLTAWLKIALIFIFSFTTLLNNVEENRPINNVEMLIGGLVISCLLFFGIPAFCKPTENYSPGWNDNPFFFKLDQKAMKVHRNHFLLISFHFFGYLLIAIGISGILNTLIRFGSFDLSSLRYIILGSGFLFGVKRAIKTTNS